MTQIRTFSIVTLGCRVNHYESEQIATLLRARGLVQTENGNADLRVIHTCSITREAAVKSRQMIRRTIRVAGSRRRTVELPVLAPAPGLSAAASAGSSIDAGTIPAAACTVVTGCWATSNKAEALKLPGVAGVFGHQDDLAAGIDELLARRRNQPGAEVQTARASACPSAISAPDAPRLGAVALPMLDQRQSEHQRAFLKIQDGCDAHCTYCIIPSLRPRLWSKPIDDAVAEASRLVGAGHREIVLTGIFLGAFGHITALRRRQDDAVRHKPPLGSLIEALCTRVPGLHRLRLSSLEPGDLTSELISVLRAHSQVVPHFHLPLQSGSDFLLRRMNRQYTRDDYLRMADRVNESFDRPAITTDIIVGFPGETEAEFAHTLDMASRVRFLHIHAFPFSPRPGTAAARWETDFIPPSVASARLRRLSDLGRVLSQEFRQQFSGETAEVLVESQSAAARAPAEIANLPHGRCERYFAIHFPMPLPAAAHIIPGQAIRIRIDRIMPDYTLGTPIK